MKTKMTELLTTPGGVVILREVAPGVLAEMGPHVASAIDAARPVVAPLVREAATALATETPLAPIAPLVGKVAAPLTGYVMEKSAETWRAEGEAAAQHPEFKGTNPEFKTYSKTYIPN
ncbi:MAG: hypothetical protein FWF23_01915 [Alphaproteobacteria bacterium]|nr:hypothetical protein [Alphaproteobacteria bacterium]MCL2505664.1 hypothetical protein [Alphaproteobacteria bacterium]